MPDTPRVFHFVFGLRPQNEPFHLAHYLCLESCRQVNQPKEIRFHYRHMPWGPWWDRIAPFLTLERVPEQAKGYDPSRYAETAEGRAIAQGGWDYAHEADFVRLNILLEHGGAYADIDTLFIRRYPDALFETDCTLGEESPVSAPGGPRVPSLCNAVIIAKAGADFIRRWQLGAGDAFDGSWSRHSCQEATRLWVQRAAPVRILPRFRFYMFGPTHAHFRALFEESATVHKGALSIHLWSHLWWREGRTDFTRFHAGLLTTEYVSAATTTYSRLAKPFLPASPARGPVSARAQPN